MQTTLWQSCVRAAPFIFAQIYLNQYERVWVCLLCVIWGYKIETLGLAFEYIIAHYWRWFGNHCLQ